MPKPITVPAAFLAGLVGMLASGAITTVYFRGQVPIAPTLVQIDPDGGHLARLTLEQTPIVTGHGRVGALIKPDSPLSSTRCEEVSLYLHGMCLDNGKLVFYAPPEPTQSAQPAGASPPPPPPLPSPPTPHDQ
jgi:hypothetical protein